MIVTQDKFASVLEKLQAERVLSLDTETTGLRMYHGDRLFSIIIATESEAFYFNFNPVTFDFGVPEKKTFRALSPDVVLSMDHLIQMDVLFKDENKYWFIQNAANFDLSILGVEGFELRGTVHCTKAIGRVEYNDHGYVKTHADKKAASPYSLEAQLFRIGLRKDDKVREFIDANNLKTVVQIPGKSTTYEKLHFDQVPFDIIVPYGLDDGTGTYKLGMSQLNSLAKQDADQPKLPPTRSLRAVAANEMHLQKTIYNMRHRGVLVDLAYCKKASAYETDRENKAKEFFKRETGRDYVASAKVFADVFQEEKSLWAYTDKGNPSFESDVLKTFKNPAARAVLEIRDSKSKADFYNGFLWFADSDGFIHPNFNPEGTVHGRFSSSEPNFQNLTSEPIGHCRACKEEIEEHVETCKNCGAKDFELYEFLVRKALIPRPGHIFIMPDYDQMEYKFMLELACKLVGGLTPLGDMVARGFDFHEATGENAKRVGAKVVRKQAKIANFLTLYGGGVNTLAKALGIGVEDARRIREAIFTSAPEILNFINACMRSAEERGYVINWLGRRSHFPVKKFSYRAPNYIVSGGCADIVKMAMNEINFQTLKYKSKMVMTIHDELPTEVHESEVQTVPRMVKEIMENVYKSDYIPLTTGMEWSEKSLGDKRKGFPV